MIKQVWVAVNPNDKDDIEIRTEDPRKKTELYFYDELPRWIGAEWKPAMLIVEDEE